MRRALTVLALSLALSLGVSPVALAATPGPPPATLQQQAAAAQSQGDCLTHWVDPTQAPQYQAEWQNLGLAQQAVVEMLNGIENAILGLGFQDLPQLIFNRPNPCLPQGEALTVWHIMTPAQWAYTVHPWEEAFFAFSLALVVLFVLMVAFKWFSIAAFDVGARIEFGNWFYNWFLGVVFTGGFLVLVNLLFTANNALVTDFSHMAKMPTSFLALLPSSHTGGILGLVILRLVATGLVVLLNFYYLFRRFSLMFLIAIGPLMGGITWFDRRTQGVARRYWTELSIDVLQQAIHAGLLAFFFALYQNGFAHGGTSWLFLLGFLVFLMPFSNMLREMFGATAVGGRAGLVASAIGLGSVAGVVGLMGLAGGSVFGRGGVAALGAGEAALTGAALLGGGRTSPGHTAGGGLESAFQTAAAPAAEIAGIATARRIGGGIVGTAAGIAGGLLGLGLGGPLGMEVLARLGGRMGASAGASVTGTLSFTRQTAEHIGAAYQGARVQGLQGFAAVSHAVKASFGGARPWMGPLESGRTVGANLFRTAAFAVGGAGLAESAHRFGSWVGSALSGAEPSYLAVPSGEIHERLQSLSPGARIVEERHRDHSVFRFGGADGEVFAYSPAPNPDVKSAQPVHRVWEVQTPAEGKPPPQGSVELSNGHWLVPISQYMQHGEARLPTSFDAALFRRF